MSVPINIFDVHVWLAFVCVILFLTSQFTYNVGPGRGWLLNKSRLRLVAIATAILFLTVTAVRVYLTQK
jgi:hypothetical protein